jgi:hypothetical protein
MALEANLNNTKTETNIEEKQMPFEDVSQRENK